MEFRTLKANEIDIRVGSVSAEKNAFTLLLYKNARADMNILDETVGAENWQREHYEVKGNMFCRVGVRKTYIHTDKDGGADYVEFDWVWKSDCGTESNTEKEKGEASDSFKRACVNWGIGRELYTAPFIRITKEGCIKNGKLTPEAQSTISRAYVSKIEYNKNREIEHIEIKTSKGDVIFAK